MIRPLSNPVPPLRFPPTETLPRLPRASFTPLFAPAPPVMLPAIFTFPIVPLLNQYGLTLFTGATGGAVPTITSFLCPNYGDSGAGQYICYITYTSGSSASVVWSGASGTTYNYTGGSEFFGRCTSGQSLRLTATVTNTSGSVSRTSARFACPTGPIP